MSNPVFDEDKRQKWVEFMQRLNPEIDPKSIRLMDEFLLTSRSIMHMGEHSVDAAGLSYARYRLLMGLLLGEEIEGRHDLNPSEISERQGTSRNTISALIRDLEEEKLVERSLDLQDRRKFNIRLTAAGRSLVEEHVRRHFRVVGDCFGALDSGEKDELSDLLAKIRLSASGKRAQSV